MLNKVLFSVVIFVLSVTNIHSQSDTLKPANKTKVFSIGGIFLSVGGGLHVPLADFSLNSDPAFGWLARLEYSSTKIFPVIVGGEINYFVFSGNEEFMNSNQLTTLKSKYLSLGLNLEYSLANIFKSTYSIPFITADVKYNIIKREISPDAELVNLPEEETRISFGIGFGITLFIFDFYVKYNYMKSGTAFGAYAKVKFPLFKF